MNRLFKILRWLLIACCTAGAADTAIATLPGSPSRSPLPLPSQSIPPVRWSQLADTVFQHFTTDSGLPQAIVTAMGEDGDGFLWVGTQGGLARWDGYHFLIYRSDSKDPGALPDNWIQTMYTDRFGRLWIGTSGGGLARYDREHDRFINTSAGPNGLSHVAVWAIADDGADGVWLGTDGGLDHFNPVTGAIKHIRHSDKDTAGLPDEHIRSLVYDRHGSLWIGTRKGLVRRDVDTHGESTFTVIALPLAAAGAVPNVFSLLEASDGRIWIGTVEHGAYVFDPKVGTAVALQETDTTGSPLANEWVYAIEEARPGELWLGTYGKGIVAVDNANMRTRRIRHDPTLPTSLADNTIWALLRDRSGLIWTGTERGLSRHDPQQTAVLTLFGASGSSNHVSDADVISLLPAADGRIWLGLGNNRVDIIDPVGHDVTALRLDTGRSDTKLANANVSAFVALKDGTHFLGTTHGLFRADQTGRAVQHLALPPRNSSEPIRALLAEDASLWIGGDADGLWKLDLGASSGAVVRPEGTEKLTDQRISVIERGPAGTLWIGTLNGLNLFNPALHTIERILPNPSDPAALSGSYITSLLTDRQGRLWVGTQGGGINILDGRDAKGQPRFHQLGLAQGLPNANVNHLLQDADGNIWASTDDGLVCVDPKTFSIRILSRADGVFIRAYWTSSGALTTQGELLFGGLGGLTVLRPDQLKEWRYRPPIVVTDVRIGGKHVAANRFNSDLSDKNADPLRIASDTNNLAVEFSALDYSSPEHNRYAYRLDGYDRDWVDTDPTRRLAAYTNLPPGDYGLHLRGSNRNGVWSEKELVIPIRVLPAWYQTWWFRLIEGLAAAVAIFALVQGRTRYLQQRQRELEHQVAQRTAQLHEKQIELVGANHELFDANKALNSANAELALSAETLRQLGNVGRDITANLDADMVFEALYRHVGGLLDAPSLAIHRTNVAANVLLGCFGRQDGQPLPLTDIAINSPTSPRARAVRERTEVLLERVAGAADADPVDGTRIMLTSLFAPLIVDQRVLGVMSIQSDREHAYGERERLIFRTLCAYGAIALANAEALFALHQAQAQLVQQEKLASLGGLVAGIAHEINTPLGTALTAISGAVDTWQKLRQTIADENLSKAMLNASADEGIEYTQLALRTASRAAALVNSFNALTVRFDSDHTDDLNLAIYLPAVAALLHKRFQQQGHRLEIEAADGLIVHIVQDALTEALTRVLANVLDHAFTDRANGTVRLIARRGADGHVEVVVSDNGKGIPPEELPQVFNPFFSTQSGGHPGLGLHVAHNHVTQRLKGEISISSTIGKGTTVTIRIEQ